MNVLITGGAGFIGSHLVRRLVLAHNASITVLDNFHRGRRGSLADFFSEIRVLEADVRDIDSLVEALSGIDLVYHLAAQSSVISADEDLNYTFSTNVAGTFNLLRAAKSNGVRRVVFTSSREVYGDPSGLPVPETAPIRPKNAYGASKAAGEAYCGAFGTDGLEVAVLRLANVYGPGDSGRVLPLFVESALQDRPLVLYGGQQILDFVWIDNVIAALVKVGFGDLIPEPLNVGSGKGIVISGLARRVVEATDSRSRIEIVRCRHAEVTRFVADVTRATQMIGLQQPKDPLFGLTELVEHARRQISLSQDGALVVGASAANGA